jgi:hypothetical protein
MVFLAILTVITYLPQMFTVIQCSIQTDKNKSTEKQASCCKMQNEATKEKHP